MKDFKYKFENLEVWQLSMKLTDGIYKIIPILPKEERFELTSQLKRAVISIPLNIAEGSGKRTKKDFANYIRIAIGSLLEVITCLKITLEQKFITQQIYDKIDRQNKELYFKLIGFEKSLNKN